MGCSSCHPEVGATGVVVSAQTHSAKSSRAAARSEDQTLSKDANYKPLSDCTDFQNLPRSYKAIENTRLAEALRRECITVVKASYFADCLDREEPMADRSNIPKDMFFTCSDVVTKWAQHGYMFLVIVSYPWLSEDHPDPDLFHLRRLVHVLRELRAYHYSNPFTRRLAADEIGVILDYCSLWQKRPAKYAWTSQKQDELEEGMKSMSDAYAHEDVTAVMLTSTPKAQRRLFDDRGWTLFESALINSKAASSRTENGERNVFALGAAFNPDTDQHKGVYFVRNYCRSTRCPPPRPEVFDEQMDARQIRSEGKGVRLFSNSLDAASVRQQYRLAYGTFTEQCKLDYTKMGLHDSGFGDLVSVLPDCTGLTELSLAGNELTRLPSTPFACLQQLRMLSLCNNSLAQLEPNVFEGLRSLRTLHLGSNGLGNLELGTFEGLRALQALYLSVNAIERLQPGIFTGLDSLETLWLDENRLALLQPGTFDGLSSLKELCLVRNSLVDPEAWKSEALRAAASCKVQMNED